jgi:hypothetical protein
MGRRFIWILDKILRSDPASSWLTVPLKAAWTLLPDKYAQTSDGGAVPVSRPAEAANASQKPI